MGGSSNVAEFRTETVTVRGCTISMLRGGAGDPLLYLHGAGGAGMVFPFMTELAARYDVMVPEHPGFGASDEPDWLDNIHDVAYFYLDFLEAMELDGVHLVGMSLGGWIALEIAVRSTVRIKTLTLAGPAGIHVPGLATGDIFAWSPAETFRQGFHDQTIAEQAIARLPENVEADDTYLKNRSTVARLAWEPRLYDPHLAKWLHRIDVPTKIVWAEDDRILPVGYADELARMIPGSQVTVIPQCGHLLHIEKPAEFVAAIDDLAKGA
jgi:pimeloyl-ACP methyl ester carboxylesterase